MEQLTRGRFLQKIRPNNIPGNWDDDAVYANALSFYLFANQFVSGKVVLDAACGYGYGCYLLARSAEQVIGVDLDGERIRYAVDHYQAPNLEYRRMDVTNLEFDDERFDVVVSIETLEHLPPAATERYLDELRRVIRCGGLLVLTTPNRTATAAREKPMRGHINEKTVAELRELIQARFEDGRWYWFLRAEQPAGAADQGRCSVSRTLRRCLRHASRLPARGLFFFEREILRRRLGAVLRRRRIRRMQTPEDERDGLIQIVVARKPARTGAP